MGGWGGGHEAEIRSPKWHSFFPEKLCMWNQFPLIDTNLGI